MIVEPDSTTRAALSGSPVAPLGLHQLVPLAVVLVLGGLTLVPTALGVHHAAGLGAPSLAEVAAGAHDPRWLPVHLPDTAPLLFYTAVLLAPFAAVGGALPVGADVVGGIRARRPLRAVLPSALVLALCLAVLVELVVIAPLIGWWLD